MSALGLATVGVQCENKALGQSSLGVFCTVTVHHVQQRGPAWDFEREDEEILTVIMLAVTEDML